MPFINGCYFSKKELKKDDEFLDSQKLTEDQKTAVNMFFQQRISSAILYSYAVITPGILILLFLIL